MEARSRNHYCRGKAITHSECVSVALVIQHAKRMRRFVSSVACLAIPYFSTLFHKRNDFRGKKLLNIKCVLGFHLQLLSETFFVVKKNSVMHYHKCT